MIDPQGINAVRCELGLSVAQLAERLGVDRKTVYRWESGESPMPQPVRLALAYLLLQTAKARKRPVTRREAARMRQLLADLDSE